MFRLRTVITAFIFIALCIVGSNADEHVHEAAALSSALTSAAGSLVQPLNVTNILYSRIMEQEIPNSFLRTGKIEFIEPEKWYRRFDIMFFGSIPISYYLTYNLLLLKNEIFYQDYTATLSKQDTIYMLANTFLIPLYVAFQDRFYIERRRVIDDQQTTQTELHISLNILNNRF